MHFSEWADIVQLLIDMVYTTHMQFVFSDKGGFLTAFPSASVFPVSTRLVWLHIESMCLIFGCFDFLSLCDLYLHANIPLPFFTS